MDLLRTEWKGKGQSEIAMARLHFTSLNISINLECFPRKHMTSIGRWVLVDFWSRRHITNIQRHSDVKINVGF